MVLEILLDFPLLDHIIYEAYFLYAANILKNNVKYNNKHLKNNVLQYNPPCGGLVMLRV